MALKFSSSNHIISSTKICCCLANSSEMSLFMMTRKLFHCCFLYNNSNLCQLMGNLRAITKKLGLARDSPQILSPVIVRKRQSYTKVESGNNGIIKKMMESKMKLVDTIINACWINLKSSNLTISLLDVKTTVECHSETLSLKNPLLKSAKKKKFVFHS